MKTMVLNKNKFNFQSPLIMGICNVTKDSFSDGGKNYKTSDALTNIKKNVEEWSVYYRYWRRKHETRK